MVRPGTSFAPGVGYPGQNIQLSGQGFIASNRFLSTKNQVDVTYWAQSGSPTNPFYAQTILGTTQVDIGGKFVFEFRIPTNARLPSTNRILVSPRFGEVLTVIHFIPNSQLTISPGAAFVGDEIIVSLAGMPTGFALPADALSIGGSRVPVPGYFGVPGEKPNTDSSGSVSFTARVPSLTSGQHSVEIIGATGELLTTSLTVLEGTLQLFPSRTNCIRPIQRSQLHCCESIRRVRRSHDFWSRRIRATN